MLSAHSLLWHYLWVAPNVLLLFLVWIAWRRGLAKSIPAFLAFAGISAICELAIYAADVSPIVSPWTFWRIDWVSVLIEGALKFVLIGGIFAHVFGAYASVARLGKVLIRGVGVALVMAAALAAAYAPQDGRFGIISGAHLLQQTVYLVESGLLLFIFLFSFYFRLLWDRAVFGISLGLSISACVHLGAWAVVANGGLSNSTRYQLDFATMAVYHACVLIWFYYLLTPDRTPPGPHLSPANSPAVTAAGGDLEGWNRELERLVHR